LVAELAACLCWFHPLVRWLAGRLRLEQEYTADAWAVSAAKDAMNYVRCLARLALALDRGHGSLAPAFWRRRPEILRRIDMLRRNPYGHSPRLGKGTAWTVAVLTAAACAVVAGVGPLRSAVADPPPAETAPAVKAPATADLHGDPLPAGALARLGTTRWRHGANITFIAYGADGKTLFTAGQDNTVRLWDLATGKEIRRFAAPKPAEIKPPVLRPTKKVSLKVEEAQVEVATAQLELAKARLEAVIRQQAKPVQVKPQPTDLPGKKVQLDKAQLDAEKAKAEAEKAKAQLVQKLSVMGNNPGSFRVALAADGKTLAIANGNVIQLYEVETGKELRKIEGLAVGLASLLFSPDGRTLAARGADGSLILLEADTGKQIQHIKAPQQPGTRQVVVDFVRGGDETSGMAFTPDGKALAVVTTEFKEQAATHSVKFWDVATGKEVGEIKVPEGVSVSALAYAPGGKVLAYAAPNPAEFRFKEQTVPIHLYEPDTGKELRQLKVPDMVQALVFSPDGKTLAIRGRSQRVRVWDTETGKELYQLGDVAPAQPRGGVLAVNIKGFAAATPEVRNLAFSPDGKQLATAAAGTVRLWDAATGKELSLSDSHQGTLVAVALAPDGQTVVSWGADRMIRRWEAATGKSVGAFPAPTGTTLAALSADSRVIALANADNSIHLHETATGKELHQIKGQPGGIAALAFSPDGQVLATRGSDSTIRLYDVARGGELRPITPQVANNPAPGGVLALDVVKGRLVAGGGSRAGLVFSPDGKLLAAPGPSSSFPGGAKLPPGARSAGGTIDLYEVTTGKVVRKIEVSQPAVSFAFSPDGRVLATENADQSITLWEVASGKQRAELGKRAVNPPAETMKGVIAVQAAARGVGVSAEPAGPATLAFSPDGRALVARGPDLSVRMWDVTAAKEVGQLKGHEGRVETLAFAADGKAVASGSADTTILLWDAAALMRDFPTPQPVELSDGAVEPLWGDLAGEDAAKAHQSVLKLAGAPKQAVPFLAERLKPAAPVDPQTVERWIADLESEKYAVRQAAVTNLAKAGEQVVPALQKLLTSQPTIETRKRVEELLDKLIGGTLSTEQLQLVRAVEALERMGTPEARELLRTLAQGAPGALPTRQAQAALAR
jgi:WD40 repeat protein